MEKIVKEVITAFNKIEINENAAGKYNLEIPVQNSLKDTPQIEDIVKLLVMSNLAHNGKRLFDESRGDSMRIVFIDE